MTAEPESLVGRMGSAAAVLAVFAAVGVGLVAFTEDATRDRIEANERAFLLRTLHDVLPPARYDNDVFNDTIQVSDLELLGSEDPVTVYRAFLGNRPAAVILTPVAPNGYSGPIRLLVGIDVDGRITGVRATSHRETPGLGDAIDSGRSDWILGFEGRSLGNPDLGGWAVKRDGGAFDQFTGATVTPRAVVKAVRNALVYFAAHRDALFADGAARGPDRQ
jgi:electron transport complex protein RnfG